MRPFIQVRELCYAFRKKNSPWVLNGIDLSVNSNEIMLIAGPSGSGKSTLCRTFNGLIPHFYGGRMKGGVTVGGRDTAGLSVGDLFMEVGMVFQNPQAQLFNRTVESEIAFGLESLGLSRQDMKARIMEVSQAMGIKNLLNRAPESLSGGEQQLTCIAAILALRPRIIVLDEPFANLDPANVFRVRQALGKIRARGTGIVVAEHRMGPAALDADRIIVVHQGQVVLDGPPLKVLAPDVMETFGLISENEAGRLALQSCGSGPLPEIVLATEDLCHEIAGNAILKKISFQLHKGECVALLGKNGAGKTTLLKHFNGLLRPSSGRVLVNGRDARTAKVSQLASQMGMAFQNPASQFFKLTVKDEILAGPLALDRLDHGWIDALVRLFRLEPLLDRPPFHLSGGEKKRVAFASALAARPDALVLDEPTAGQDGHFRKALGGFLAELKLMGCSVVFATHDLGFAAQNAPRWVVMAKGTVVADGPAADIAADRGLMELAGLRPPKGRMVGD